MNVFVSHALTRSGSHAVLEWIGAHYDGYVRLDERVLGDQYRTVATWKNRKLCRPKTNYPFDAILRSCENHRDAGGYIPGYRHYLLIRSFYNLAASRIRTMQKFKAPVDLTVTCGQWTDDAVLAVCRPQEVIKYDQWHTDERYRDSVRSRLSLPNVTAAEDYKVSNMANSYSYFTTPFISGSRLHRWQTVIDEPEFRQTLANDEIRELNYTLFGWTLNKDGTRIQSSY